ncbi:Phosphate transport system permease protein 1 [Burkholderia cenocepacia PC184]|nr:Phosphate transport system permease protein 1 [Burkholderia cenocepacia PC184]
MCAVKPGVTAPGDQKQAPMSDISYTSSRSPDSAQQRAPSRLGDVLFGGLARLAAIVTLLLLGGIIVSLIIASMPTIQKFGLGFLWQSEWDPNSDIYGALVPIYGTIVTSIIALVIAVPVSFGIALFLTELSPVWLRRPLGIAIELLAAIPSIVYGMWGLLVFAPIFAEYFQKPLGRLFKDVWVLGPLTSGPPIGIGILAAGVILAIMIIPYIASVMRDVFEVTPVLLKESAYGIGCTTWEVMWKVVLPYTKTGVIGGVMLGPRPRARRDDGRDLRDRQHEPARQRVAVARYSITSRSRRSRAHGCTRRADDWLICRDHVIVLSISTAAARSRGEAE